MFGALDTALTQHEEHQKTFLVALEYVLRHFFVIVIVFVLVTVLLGAEKGLLAERVELKLVKQLVGFFFLRVGLVLLNRDASELD